jgi:nitrogen-specific signal transduction histidine kinase
MPPWFSMPPHELAPKLAALAELRSALAGIRSAAELIARDAHSASLRSLAWAIARSAARGERAIGRLEPSKVRGKQWKK